MGTVGTELEFGILILEFHLSKGRSINFLRFFTDGSADSKKIEMKNNYGTLQWSKDQDFPHFR